MQAAMTLALQAAQEHRAPGFSCSLFFNLILFQFLLLALIAIRFLVSIANIVSYVWIYCFHFHSFEGILKSSCRFLL